MSAGGRFTARFLLPEEFAKVARTFKEHDWALTHPAIGSIAVVEDAEGNIAGFVACEAMAHIGPAWVAPEHRGSPELWGIALSYIRGKLEPSGAFPGVIMVADTPATERIAERLGMERAKGALYVKDWRERKEDA